MTPKEIPATIGRYEIRKELGRGMMGVVYEAHDPALNRRIALKTIRFDFARSDEDRLHFEERFLVEARVAARLSHPGIVVVHDVGQDAGSGLLFIALEYLSGRTLAETVAGNQKMEWREALRITQGIAEALYHAHTQGVIHRDVKPANIMILESGQPKIMDFGIAKIESSQLTAAGQFFGTPLYMSPEQALGQSLDARSDLFSLGALAYGLLTGQNAFGAAGVPRIITRVIHEDPAPPTTIVPGLPADIDYFIARAIAKKPDDRYPSGQAMAEDAADILADTSPRHRPDGTTPQAADGTLMSLGSEHLQEEPASQAANSLPIVAVPEPARPRPRSARGATAARAPQPLPRKRAISSGVLGLALVVVVIASLAAITVGWLVLRARATQQAPSSVAPATSARPADAAAPVASDKARLIIDCEHSLKYGKLRVWVDDALIVEETLSGRVAKKVIAFEIRKGTFAQALDLSPGTHEVKVQFAWDDNIKTEHIAGYFSSGTSRRLSIKLGAGMRGLVKKDLKVDWE